ERAPQRSSPPDLDLPRRRLGTPPARPHRRDAARAACRDRDEPRRLRVHRGRRRHRRDHAGEPAGVRQAPDRPAHAARRLEARSADRAARPHDAEPVPRRADRRARDGRPQGRRRRRPRGAHARDRNGPVQPGLAPDGAGHQGARRHPALVPALLEHRGRARRELRQARGEDRLRRDRHHARHDAARLAHPRPRPRVPAVPQGQGHRAVHERRGLPAHHAHADRPGSDAEADAQRDPHAGPAHPRVPRALQPGRRPRGGAALHADLLAPVARVGHAAVPARAHEAADPPQGDPAPRRRVARGGGGHRRDRRLQPRRPPGRRLDRHARRAARHRRRGRREDAGAVRQRDPQRRGRLQGAGPRRGRRAARPPVRLRPGDRGRARRRRGARELPGRLRPDDGPVGLHVGRRDHARGAGRCL
ncbi:MAG: Lactate 2-monooxygenase, partial [uncultured Solirubrobacteraceae bacterium]